MKGRVVVAAAACALAVAGCSADSGGLDAADSPVASYDWDSGGARMAALLEGTLELRDGCLVVNLSYDPYTPVVAVFPRALTTWDANQQVLSYAGVDYSVGDAIAAGGGGGQTVPTEGIPTACLPLATTEGGLFFIQDETIATARPAG